MRSVDRISNWIVVVLLGLLVVLCLMSMRFNAPTSDEQNHLSRGYHYLVTGNLDLNVAPPLVNALSGVPLLFLEGITFPGYDTSYRTTYINKFADEFVWAYNDAETVINGGRLAIIFLSVLLGYFCFRWARDLGGVKAGLLALFLYVLDPNILAHSQLVTADLGVTCFIFVATYFLWRFLRWRRNVDLVLAGVLLGMAQAAKQTALLLIPVFVLIVLVEAFLVRDVTLRGRWPWRARFSRKQWRGLAYFVCGVLVVLLLFALLSLWASYRFEAAPLTGAEPGHATIDRLIRHPALRKVAYYVSDRMWLPFPTYFRGLQWLGRYSQRGAPGFLMGEHSRQGWWYYFLVAFIIKTPIPTLALIAAAVYWTVRRGTSGAKQEYVLYVPVVAFFAATLFSFLNIGYRHILPVLPFLFVFASKVAVWSKERYQQVALAVLCLWLVVGTGRIHPHYLAYFNELVGGPDNGHNYLVDSNLDWGQDLENLKTYMDQNGLQEIHLAYFGSAHADYYGIRAKPLPMKKPDNLETNPPEIYAISATYLQSGYLGDGEAYSWLQEYEPFAKLGYSIFLYRLP